MLNSKKEYAIKILIAKAEELGGIPQKCDFTVEKVSLIKSCLGPWPRALEKAGLKPVSDRIKNRKK